MSAKRIYEEIMEHAPEKGYELCSIDCHELPVECLSLIAHFDKWEEAVKAREEWTAAGNNVVVYGK